MYQSLDSSHLVVEYTRVANTTSETYTDQVLAEGLLPPFGSVPRPVQAKAQLADLVGTVVGIFRWQLDVDIAIDLGVEIRPPDVVHHQLASLISP